MATITLERTINKPLNKVWEVIGDFMRSPGPSVKVTPVKEGNPELNLVGAERMIKFGKSPAILERLESVNPPNSLSFSIVKGAPLKSLLIKSEFIATGETTKTKWVATYTQKYPLPSWIVEHVIKRNMSMILDETENAK